MSNNKARTLGELRATGYQSRTVKEEMRLNLIEKLRKGDDIFPGIVGYEETVIPQIENAILSGQDIVFLGERGQAKTRIARSLINLLDEEVPVIQGADLNDDPLNPISAVGKSMVSQLGEDTPIEWLHRSRRYGEKLATPDITISDLIGEVDPIKVAEGRYLSDEMTIHYGLIPRTNRGIFALNELPDLAERIQVGMLNIMEERDVQIRGYKIRLDLDVFVVASANPEDYTNRGRIVTPLKDRFGSEIRTHYPKTIDHEINIIEQESTKFKTEGIELIVPRFMKEIVAEVTHLARRSPDISQRSGVSVRVSVSNFENLISNSLRRAIILGEKAAAPRISDLHAIITSTAGKIELETMGESKEERIVEKLVQGAVVNTFNRYFTMADFEAIIRGFDSGLNMEASEFMPAMEYVHQAAEIAELKKAVAKLQAQGSPVLVASAVEFVLEGLHLNRKLNKDRSEGKARYRR